MKITFVNIGNGTFHHGIAALSAYLKQKSHHEVSLIDLIGTNKSLTFQEQLRQHRPDILGLSAMTPFWPYVKVISELTKKVHPVPVICGGYHPTFEPEEAIAQPAIDMICRGDGEDALLELLNALERGEDYTNIHNLWVKKDGKLYQNPMRPLCKNVDELPFWDRELFNYKKWYAEMPTSLSDMDQPERIVTLSASRGCYFHCTYCSNKALREAYHSKPKDFVRTRSVDNVITEMKQLKAKYNPDLFEFQEELFVARLDWVEEFADRYPKEVGVPFNIAYRVELANDRNLSLLAKAGCVGAAYGVECGNEEYRRKYLSRNMSNQKIYDAFAKTQEHGIRALSFNIIALPYETYDLIQETVELNRKLKPDLMQWFIFQPFPGTHLYNFCKENDLLIPGFIPDSYVSFQPSIKLTHITPEELKKCIFDLMNLQEELQGYNWVETFRESNETVVDIRPYRAGDEYQIMDLYNQTFIKSYDMNYWQWYIQNPEGDHHTIVAASNRENIVAAHTTFPLRFWYQENEYSFIQTLNFRLSVWEKAGLQKFNGQKENYPLAYEFVTKKEFPVEYRDFVEEGQLPDPIELVEYDYTPIRKINKLRKNISPQPRALGVRVKHCVDKRLYPVKKIDRYDVQADQLWQECQSDFSMAIVRNAKYLNWRYVDRPGIAYLNVGVYRQQKLRGWAVLRVIGEVGYLVDWLVPTKEIHLAEILLRNVENSAYLGGAKYLDVWFPPAFPQYAFFQEHGYAEIETNTTLFAHILDTNRIDSRIIENEWYYTMGDSEAY